VVKLAVIFKVQELNTPSVEALKSLNKAACEIIREISSGDMPEQYEEAG
jgi:hypothetical protein